MSEKLARQFHEVYEQLAPSFGYETRKDTKQFDPSSPNGKLMIAVTDAIEDALRAENERLEQRIRELEEAQRWIPVSKRLPEVDTRVEIFGGFEQTTHIGYYREHAKQWDSEDGCYWHGKNFGLITHWRPLPEPPEEK